LLAGGDPLDWDLAAPQFRRNILAYVQQGVYVTLVVPQTLGDRELLADLWALTRDGVNVCCAATLPNSNIVAQTLDGTAVQTFATRGQQGSTPGPQWHNGGVLVVTSASVPSLTLDPLTFPKLGADSADHGAVNEFSVRSELDGPLSTFGERFWSLVAENCAQAAAPLAGEKIVSLSYTDRYLQSPTAVSILGSVLRNLKGRFSKDAKVKVRTVFRRSHRNEGRVFDDWVEKDDFASFAAQWLSTKAGVNVDVLVADSNREVAHHRTLQAEFENGGRLQVRLDQGVGYWQVRVASPADRWFDFKLHVADQLMHLGRLVESAQVKGASDQFETPLVARFEPAGTIS